MTKNDQKRLQMTIAIMVLEIGSAKPIIRMRNARRKAHNAGLYTFVCKKE
jgi:hypothetical protein